MHRFQHTLASPPFRATLALAFLIACHVQPGRDPAAENSTPLAADANWLARAQQHIAEREYWASPNREGLQAPNRAHDLRTYFEPTGLRVHDRTAPDSPLLLSMQLRRLGRGDALREVPAGAVANERNRVEIRREELVEWYVNRPQGLEQGFTLAKRPAGEGDLVLEIAIAGAEVSVRGDAAVLTTRAGRRLRYGHLQAFDAGGRRLPARIESGGEATLRLAVTDAEAAYPLIVDPLLTATDDAQIESDQDFGQLGASVAGAGDVNGDGFADVIVGANDFDAGQAGEGAAFVFHGGVSGIGDRTPATADAQLESDQAGASMGVSVAGAGDVNGDGFADVIVGATNFDAGEATEGAAFVFHGGVSGIGDRTPATADAQLESDQVFGLMGFSVGGAGDVNGDGFADVIVGANHFDAGETDEGAAFVFHGGVTGIGDRTPATADAQLESDQDFARMGASVAGAGDVNGDGFADVIVGADDFDAGQAGEGAAFVFHGGVSGIGDRTPATADAQLESDQAGASMGVSVAGAGDVNGDGFADVIVGADDFDAGETDEGAAFVFHGGGSGIGDRTPATADAQLESDQDFGLMGDSVAGAGDVNGDGFADVIVGAFVFDAGQTDEGAAFVFHGGATGVADGTPASAVAFDESDQAGAELGFSVANAGDVNGDGFSDVIVGAPLFDDGETDEGAAFIYHGSAGVVTPEVTPDATFQANQPAAQLGYSVAGAGDLNGDGYGDVIIGAPFYNSGSGDEGAAFLFYGSASGTGDGDPATAPTRLESDQNDARMGFSVSGAGDVNGDSLADVIVGAPNYDDGETDEGGAFVFHGGVDGITNGIPATAAARLQGNEAVAGFGWSVSHAGDVNGDGYADVIVGSPFYSPGDNGAAFVFEGGPAGVGDGDPGSGVDTTLLSPGSEAQFGWDVAEAGDVNGDGFDDVIVGARVYSNGASQEGGAFVFHGASGGIADVPPAVRDAQVESEQTGARLGHSVSGAGDVNADGYADVIVGALFYDNGQSNEGLALVFEGSAAGLLDGGTGGGPADAATWIHGNQADAELGRAVSGAGDLNGDGVADVIVGASGYTNGQADEGRAMAFARNDGGLPLQLQQLRGDGSGIPVEPWGKSYSADSFEVALRARHPNGAGRVRAEVETCPAGTPFADVSCTTVLSPAWVAVDGGTPSAQLGVDVTGLTTGTLYRWRARVLQAPPTGPIATLAAHGPWLRLAGGFPTGGIRAADPLCDDGLDNDGDGLTDFADDPGCAAATDDSETSPALLCDDGKDNDGDGRTDFDPVTAASPGDPNTPPAGVGDPGCRSPTWLKEDPQCQDGVNNDPAAMDGTDYDGGYAAGGPSGGTPDPQCTVPWKNCERLNCRCGLGFELAVLLCGLAVLRGYRRR